MYFIMRHIRFEIFIDKMVPYALMFVILHMILNLFFLDIIHDYEDLLIFLEFFLITFVLGFDVVFKYRRSTSKKYFLKHHWLEIFAVFPFQYSIAGFHLSGPSLSYLLLSYVYQICLTI